MRAVSVISRAPIKFPREGVTLGSWANVWLQHVKDQPIDCCPDELHLTDGEHFCRAEVSRTNVPAVFLPWTSSGDYVDLSKEGCWWQRGCIITSGHFLTGRSLAGQECGRVGRPPDGAHTQASLGNGGCSQAFISPFLLNQKEMETVTAGFQFQNGLAIVWDGSIITRQYSRVALSKLFTAEAE